MKKILISLTAVFITVSLCFADSKRDQVVAEYLYYSKIEKKIEDMIVNVNKQMREIDDATEGKDNKEIINSIAILDDEMQALEKQMNIQASKIKTPEVKQYYYIELEYVKLLNNFLKDTAAVFKKQNKIDEKKKEYLTKKYAGEFEKLRKKEAEFHDILMEIIRPAQFE
ncbi:MAG: hypothetical protein K2N11_08380 [Mucispirillum sp.]|nr:hypothetical protein [Mucispirillum sp.]